MVPDPDVSWVYPSHKMLSHFSSCYFLHFYYIPVLFELFLLKAIVKNSTRLDRLEENCQFYCYWTQIRILKAYPDRGEPCGSGFETLLTYFMPYLLCHHKHMHKQSHAPVPLTSFSSPPVSHPTSNPSAVSCTCREETRPSLAS